MHWFSKVSMSQKHPEGCEDRTSWAVPRGSDSVGLELTEAWQPAFLISFHSASAAGPGIKLDNHLENTHIKISVANSFPSLLSLAEKFSSYEVTLFQPLLGQEKIQLRIPEMTNKQSQGNCWKTFEPRSSSGSFIISPRAKPTTNFSSSFS